LAWPPPRRNAATRPHAVHALFVVAFLSGCDGGQSALNAAGAESRQVLALLVVMAAGSLLVWLAVLALAYWSSRNTRDRDFAHRMVLAGGLVVTPVVVLALLVHGLRLMPALRDAPAQWTVRIDGEQYWWRIGYVGPGGNVSSANELVLPRGEASELLLASEGVIHSLWVPAIAGKMDLIPGRINRLVVRPERAGDFRGQCAEFCGTGHAYMGLVVRVLEPGAFRAWLDAQAGPARKPEKPEARDGKRLFLASGCGACHAIRGTAAAGTAGPDLTHYGSRATVAAALYPMNIGTTAGWIAGAQELKPGSHMPSFGRAIAGADLRAIAAYLVSLE
jgi:cytochrome c oxidase subunit 2